MRLIFVLLLTACAGSNEAAHSRTSADPSPLPAERSSESPLPDEAAQPDRTGPILPWSVGRGWHDRAVDPVDLEPVPDGFQTPEEAPRWILEALRSSQFFQVVEGEPAQCVAFQVQGDRVETEAFHRGERTVRETFELHVENEPLVFFDRERRSEHRVTQVGVSLSGPEVSEQRAPGEEFHQAESLRDILSFAIVGGNSDQATVVPSMLLVRAYHPEAERHWYRTREACETAVEARGPSGI